MQVVHHDMFRKAAIQQYQKDTEIPARRGRMMDRNGYELATNTIYYDLAVDPVMLKDKTRVATLCDNVLTGSRQHYLNMFRSRNDRHQFLARKVPLENARPLLALHDPGLIIREHFRRRCPYDHYGAQLIGFTDPDDNGLGGLELQYDDILKGVAGQAVIQYDGPRNAFYNPDYPLRKPVHGEDVILTIDKNIQTVLEQELKQGVLQAKAEGGMAVVINPSNGAVLAMANYPSFDPNVHQRFGDDRKRNRVITDVFEPGSTLKLFTAAALLQENLKKPDDIVYCEQGRYTVYDQTFHDTKSYGWLSMRRVIENSSNIGMIKLGGALHANTLFRYLKNFGFGTKTGIELNAEAKGLLESPRTWSGTSQASISIGYEIGVTALQLATAYAAIINGGYLYRPFVVSHRRPANGNLIELHKPLIVRQVISNEVSDVLKSFMHGVVERGTGKRAKPKGLEVGGKTGTALKLNQEARSYYRNRYTASFVGFAQYEQPEYVCAVIMDEPKKGRYGGEVAAPVFRNVMQRIMFLDSKPPIQSRQKRPEYKLANQHDVVPSLNGFKKEHAVSFLKAKSFEYEIRGNGPQVVDMKTIDDRIVLETGKKQVHMKRMPDLTGLSKREAMTLINFAKLYVQIEGSGEVVTGQTIKAGTPTEKRSRIILYCN